MGDLTVTTAELQSFIDGETQRDLDTQALGLSEIKIFHTDAEILEIDGSASTGQDVQLEHIYEAFKFTASKSTNIKSFGIYAKSTGAITNVAHSTQMWIYTDNAGEPGSQVGVIQESLRFGYIAPTTHAEYQTQTASVDLVDGTDYWIVIKAVNDLPSGGTIVYDTVAS